MLEGLSSVDGPILLDQSVHDVPRLPAAANVIGKAGAHKVLADGLALLDQLVYDVSDPPAADYDLQIGRVRFPRRA